MREVFQRLANAEQSAQRLSLEEGCRSRLVQVCMYVCFYINTLYIRIATQSLNPKPYLYTHSDTETQAKRLAAKIHTHVDTYIHIHMYLRYGSWKKRHRRT